MVFSRFAQIAPKFLIEPSIRVFDAVFDGVQFARREELVLASDQHICPLVTVHVFAEAGWIDGLMRDGIVPIPAQDVVPSSPNENVSQKIGQLSVRRHQSV